MKDEMANEWFQRAKHDFEVAKLLFKEKHYFDIGIFHVHQAVEKYLKGFLIQNSWKLKKIHDIELLITEAINYNPKFESFLDFGRKLSGFYYEERYPPGPLTTCSKDDFKEMLDTAQDIIDIIINKG
jgi:HEPN domain-containing protein